MSVKEKFIRYIAFDTMSDETSNTFPSTTSQVLFGKKLVEELHAFGIKNAYQDEYGYVYAALEGTLPGPKVGLIAHMDTSSACKGGITNPREIKSYSGGAIQLNPQNTLTPELFPNLQTLIGHDLMVTDGEHLLGGDDKAGIAIIMELLQFYQNHPEQNHFPIRICFTPDEEIGQGALYFSCEKMDADFAYTLDGGALNELNDENFNAASCVVHIQGVSVHPGSAKDIMVNASQVAIDFHQALPPMEVPEKTEGYQGFYHLTDIKGDVENATLSYILRDHDKQKLIEKKQVIRLVEEKMKQKYPQAIVQTEIKDSYENMKEYFKNHSEVVDRMVLAYQRNGIQPTFSPIRGGTDGARITFMGLPCPNIGVGDYGCHGRFEHVSITEMEKAVLLLRSLLEN